MYPAVAALSNLYGGANGVQNTGRVMFPGYPMPGSPQPAAYAGGAQAAGPPNMTPAQRGLYNRYMNLPGGPPPPQPNYAPLAQQLQQQSQLTSGFASPAPGTPQPAQPPPWNTNAPFWTQPWNTPAPQPNQPVASALGPWNNATGTPWGVAPQPAAPQPAPIVNNKAVHPEMGGGVLPYGAGGVAGLARYYAR